MGELESLKRLQCQAATMVSKQNSLGHLMKIGHLAATADTQADTIRYYEREGLLPKALRSHANYRIYGPEHVQRLAFIRQCRSMDMSLAEIRALLRFMDAPAEDCTGVNALIDEHLAHVSTRLEALRRLQRQLQGLRERCAQAGEAQNCGILKDLALAAASAPRSVQLKPAARHEPHFQHTHP